MTLRPLTIVDFRRLALGLAGLCGLAGVLIEYGTHPRPWQSTLAHALSAVAVGLFLVEQVLARRQAGSFRRYLRGHWPTFVLSLLLAAEGLALLAGVGVPDRWRHLRAGSLTRAYVIAAQIYLAVVLALRLPHLHRRFASLRVRPAAAFVLAFLGLIAAGTGLLLLPRATPDPAPISVLDAAFTATSAVCVTGLVVRDTATGFTGFGQAVILVLIQLGGLGIMSLTAALGLLLGRGIGVRESSLLREVFQIPMLTEVGRMVRVIVLVTAGCEAAGAIVLYVGLGPVIADPGARLFAAVFHAVSAFCNAGFSTFGDSLVGLADRPLVMAPVTVLLVLGGLGFAVIAAVAVRLRGRSLRLDLHAHTVLLASGLLLALGTATLAALEWNGALAGGGPGHRLAQAFFQSATCRTAGFNSLDLGALAPASVLLMIVLMFIGGAPGSTAGGVKVTVMAVLWANLRALARGSARVTLRGRELDPVHGQRAMLVISAGLAAAAAALFVLLVSESADFATTAFEVFSALGTVGLSLGLTPELSVVGRLVVMSLMFLGRLGPLTLAASVTGAGHEPRVRLPHGRILIG